MTYPLQRRDDATPSEASVVQLNADPPSIASPATVSYESPAHRQPTLIIGENGESFEGVPADATRGGLADYELIEEIGRGSHGIVYRARQRSLDRVVAVKILFPDAVPDAETANRFRRAMEQAARLDHPGIVRVYEVGSHEGRHYVAMALCEGRSLDALLSNETLPAVESARLMRELAEVLHAAHAQGVVHFGLKPSQVFVGANGSLKVTDFGLAVSQGIAPGPVEWTHLAPEQLRAPATASKAPGPRTDVYAMGSLLYSLLTGRPPFEEKDGLTASLAVRQHPPIAPSRLNPKVNGDLDAICFRCLESSAWRRYPGPVDVMGDLLRWLNHRPLKRAETSLWRKAALWVQRSRSQLLPLLIVFLVLGVIPGAGRWIRNTQIENAAWSAIAAPGQPPDKIESARRHFERASRQLPWNQRARVGHALARFRQQPTEENARLLLDDEDALPFDLVAVLRFQTGEIRKAAEAWGKRASTPASRPVLAAAPQDVDSMFQDLQGLRKGLRSLGGIPSSYYSGYSTYSPTALSTFCNEFLTRNVDDAAWQSDAMKDAASEWSALLTANNGELQAFAMSAIGRMGTSARAVLPALAELAIAQTQASYGTDDRAATTIKAIHAIDPKWTQSSAARPVVDKLIDYLTANSGNPHPTLRLVAEFGEGAKRTSPRLIEWLGKLSDYDGTLRDLVCTTLDQIDPEWRASEFTVAQRELWQKQLREPYWSYLHEYAAKAIGSLGEAGRPAMGELMAHLANDDQNARQMCEAALARIDKDWATSKEARSAVPLLIVSAANGSDDRRPERIAAIDKIDPDWRKSPAAADGARRLAEKFHEQQNWIQHQRIALLQEIGERARPALPVLIECLLSNDEPTRDKASTAISRIDAEGWKASDEAKAAIPAIGLRLTDWSPDVRSRARKTLSEISPRWKTDEADRIIPELSGWLISDDPAVAKRAMEALDADFPEWPRSPSVRKLTGALLMRTVRTNSLDQTYLTILNRLDPPWHTLPEAAASVPDLAKLLKVDRSNWMLAVSPLERLARIGPRARAAAPDVVPLVLIPQLQSKAILALDRIAPEELRGAITPPAGMASASFRTAGAPATAEDMHWQTATWQFIARSDRTRIEFLSLDDRDPVGGPKLDDVRIAPLAVADGEVNLLENGGFEDAAARFEFQSSSELVGGSTLLAGWTVVGQSIDLVGNAWKAHEGKWSVDLNGSRGCGGIAQTIATKPGTTYHVSFSLAGNHDRKTASTLLGLRAAPLSRRAEPDERKDALTPEEFYLGIERQFLTALDPDSAAVLRRIDASWPDSPFARSAVPRIIRRRLANWHGPGTGAALEALGTGWPQLPEARATIGELAYQLQDVSRREGALATLNTIDEHWRSTPHCREAIGLLLGDLDDLPAHGLAQRVRILDALAEIGPPAAGGARAIIPYVAHENLPLAEAAVRALDAIDPRWPQTPAAKKIVLDLTWRGLNAEERHAKFAKEILDRIPLKKDGSGQ